MKKTRRLIAGIVTFILAAVMAFAFAACGEDEDPIDPERKLESLTVDASGAKTTFDYGSEFSYDGIKITAVYDDGSTEPVDIAEVRVTGYDTLRPGRQNVRVIWGGQTGRYMITVLERQLPELDPKPLVEIKGENPEAPYRVEAENINMAKTGAEKADADAEFTADPPADSSHATSGKYLTNYGVVGNYFGFKFTSDAEYGPSRDVSIALRVSNPNDETLSLADSFKMYLNYETVANSGEVSMEGKSVSNSPVMKTVPVYEQQVGDDGLPVYDEDGNPVYVQETDEGGNPVFDDDGNPVYVQAKGEDGTPLTEQVVDYYEQDNWVTMLFRGEVAIKEGENTLAFEVFGEEVPNIDYIDIFVGNLASNSLVRVEKVETIVKEFEDFDLEKVVVREDFKNAHGLKDGEIYLESTPTNPNTSKGTSAAAIVTGTEITTQLLVEEDATVRISIDCASIGDYRVKDHWQFFLDDTQLTDVEDKNIKAGSAADSTYWEWGTTRIAQLDIEAGQYLFTAKITGAGCNIDCFRFEVLSYGEFLPEISSLTVTKNPDKTEYYQSENFDPTGLVVTANYANGSNADVTGEVVYNKTNNLAVGDVITATYGGQSVNIPVTIKALTEIELTENKTYTVEAEQLDRSGVITRSDFVAQRGLKYGEVMVAEHPVVSGGKIIEGFAGSGADDAVLRRAEDKDKGTVFTLSVKTNGAATINFGIRMASDRPEHPAGTFIDCSFNGQKLTPVPGTDDIPAGTAENPFYNCADVDLGTVTVDEAGTYTLTINVLMRFNFDCLTFDVSGIA